MPFYWATDGRGTLDTRLPVDMTTPDYLPGDPTPTPTPTLTSQPTTLVPTRTTVAESPTPTVDSTSPGRLPICNGLFGVLGLVLIPGIRLLLKKRHF